MKVELSLYSCSFKGAIYDAHAHGGHWEIDAANAKSQNTPLRSNGKVLHNFLVSDTLEILNKPLNKDNDTVEKFLVSNLDCMTRKSAAQGAGCEFLKGEVDGNVDFLKQFKDNSKVGIYAVCQPGYGAVSNIEKIFEENPNGFVGLKFHPPALNLRVDNPAYEQYLEFAQKRKLPCLFHSGCRVDWVPDLNGKAIGKLVEERTHWDCSDPRLIYNLAKKYPATPIILGHTGAGGEPAHKVAMEVLFNSIDNKDANLYAEFSWMDFSPEGKPVKNPKNLIEMIKGLKKRNALDKILFGTDAPLGCYGETARNANEVFQNYSDTISKIKNAVKKHFPNDSEIILDKLFYQNARKLFFDSKAENIREHPLTLIKSQSEKFVNTGKKTKNGKLLLIAAGVLLAAGTILAAVYTKLKKNFSNIKPTK